MGIAEGTIAPKSVRAEYDFAVDGGAQSTIVLRGIDSIGNEIPGGSVITSGFIDIETDCDSATGTIAVQVEGAEDILAESLEAALVAAIINVVPLATGVTAVKTTVTRSIAIVIATADFTAGKFVVVLYYV